MSLSLPGTVSSLGIYSWHISLKTQGKTGVVLGACESLMDADPTLQEKYA